MNTNLILVLIICKIESTILNWVDKIYIRYLLCTRFLNTAHFNFNTYYYYKLSLSFFLSKLAPPTIPEASFCSTSSSSSFPFFVSSFLPASTSHHFAGGTAPLRRSSDQASSPIGCSMRNQRTAARVPHLPASKAAPICYFRWPATKLSPHRPGAIKASDVCPSLKPWLAYPCSASLSLWPNRSQHRESLHGGCSSFSLPNVTSYPFLGACLQLLPPLTMISHYHPIFAGLEDSHHLPSPCTSHGLGRSL